MIADHHQARLRAPRDGEMAYRPLPPDRLYLDRDQVARRSPGASPRSCSPPSPHLDGARGDRRRRPRPARIFAAGATSRSAEHARNAFDLLAQQAAEWGLPRPAAPRRTIVAAWTRGSRERLATLLREHELRATVAETWDEAVALDPAAAGIALVTPRARARLRRRAVRAGVRAGPARRTHLARASPAAAAADQFIAEATEIAEGDLVVHQDYGIGRYDGLETLTVGPRAARLPPPPLRRRREALPPGREHRAAVPLRLRGRRRRPPTASAAPPGRPARRA